MRDRLRSVLRCFPNAPLAAVAVLGLAGELILLARNPMGALSHGPFFDAFCVVTLAWIWLTIAWAIFFASRAVREKGVARAVSFVLVSLAGSALGIAYFASWGYYRRVGELATVETLRFINACRPGAESNMIVLYLAELRAALGSVALALLGAPALLAVALRAPPTHERRAALRTWLYTALVASALLCGWRFDYYMSDTLTDIATRRLNPVVALALTAIEAFRSPPIPTALDTSGLVPRGPVPDPDVRDRRNVLFVKIESMRGDAVPATRDGRVVTPNLVRLAESGRRFTRAYAPATHSDYSDCSVHTSRYPLMRTRHVYYTAEDPWPRSTIGAWLGRAGYATGFFSSQDLGWSGMEWVLSPGLDVFVDARVSARNGVRAGAPETGAVDDEGTYEQAVSWIEDQVRRKRPFFATVDFQASHFPYALPPGAEHPFEPSTIDFPVSFIGYPEEKTDVMRNAYHNALHRVDHFLGKLVATLDRVAVLDSTIVAVWGDHGEMFHERKGYVTHSREPFEVVARVPLVLRAPGIVPGGLDDAPVELIDIAPTVCGLLGMPRHPSFQGVDLFSNERPPAEERVAFVHAYSIGHADAVVVGGRWKLIDDRESGVEQLYDLATDPDEKDEVSATKKDELTRTRSLLAAWRRQQLAYHAYAFYYDMFFPPRALSRWRAP